MGKLTWLFMLFLCISQYSNCQDLGTETRQEDTKKPIAFTIGFSKVINVENKEFDIYAGVMLERKNGWGYGLDLTRSSYTPSSLQGFPPVSEIEDFEGTDLPEGLRKTFRSGERDNRLYSLSPNIFKSFYLNNKKSIKLYFTLGPSIIYSEDYEYRARFSPGSDGGGFGFPSPPSLEYRRVKEDKKVILGGFSRASVRYRFNNIVGIEFSAYGNINGTKSVYGLQFGVVLGRLF